MKTYIAYASRQIVTRKEIRGVVYKGRDILPVQVKFQAPEGLSPEELRDRGVERVARKWKTAWLNTVLSADAPPPKLWRLHEMGYI